MIKTLVKRAAIVGVSAGVARATTSFIERYSQHFSSWQREHSDGTPVSLTEGIVASAAGIAGALFLPGKAKMAGLSAVISGAIAGYIDDHLEDRFPAQGKGFKGHIGALLKGEVTSGAVKIVTVGAGSAFSALFLPHSSLHSLVRAAQWAGQTILIAGSANLINLLDLRPGRAIKAGCAAVSPSLLSTNLISAAAASAGIGVGIGCFPEDVRGETMLGDMGANAFGALLGVGIASTQNPYVIFLAATDVIGLTLLSEKYSFTKIIEDTPFLDWIDKLGRF